MEMHQIRYFLAVAEDLNFTKAAERCNVSQPALSRAIQALEQELGGPLFRRERSHTHLSELGRMVQPHLAEVLDSTQSARRLAQEYGRLKKTPMKLGIMSTIAPDEIIDLIGAVRTRHPGIELRLCDSDAKDLRARLLNGDLELAVYALPGAEPDERTHVMSLFRERMVIAVGLGHRLANQSTVRVKDIDGENYIHRNNCEFAGYADATPCRSSSRNSGARSIWSAFADASIRRRSVPLCAKRCRKSGSVNVRRRPASLPSSNADRQGELTYRETARAG